MPSVNPEQLRLLICDVCNSVQPIPWCGTEGDCSHSTCMDPLNTRIAEHKHFEGDTGQFARLAGIEKAVWENPEYQRAFLNDLAVITGKAGDGQGLGAPLYEAMANYEEQAHDCWARKHNRTTDCGDYKSAKMKLTPDTKALRKDLGLTVKDKFIPGSTYLCDYCPMKSIMQTKVYSKQYDYTDPYK